MSKVDELYEAAQDAGGFYQDALAQDDFPRNYLGIFQTLADPATVIALIEAHRASLAFKYGPFRDLTPDQIERLRLWRAAIAKVESL